MITTVGRGLLGFAIEHQFNDTTLPFLLGFSLCGGAALLVALWANRPPARDTHDEAEVDIQETASRPG